MPSVKSCFSLALFRKNLTRFWPLWSVWLVFLVLQFPVRFLLNARNYVEYGASLPQEIYWSLGDMGILFLFATAAILAAMAVFSYLYNARSVNMLHSLPVTRECLFVTNYLSGLLFLVVPVWVAGLGTLAVQAGLGVNAAAAAGLWLLLATLEVFFFYSFAVFCAMFTGHLLALPAFFIILNFLAWVLLSVLDSLFRLMLYGYATVDWMSALTVWLTPMLCLQQNVGFNFNVMPRYAGIPNILLYALVGLVLTVLALVAYRKRKLESAGDVVAIRWVRPIFKYGVAFTSAVVLGMAVYTMFAASLPSGPWAALLFLVLAGVAGYFAGEMLLKKTFKVFRRSWKGAVVFTALLVLAGSALALDLIGYDHLPDQGRIESVTLSNVSTMPDDSGSYANLLLEKPEEIEAALRLHQTLIDSKALSRSGAFHDGENTETVTLASGWPLSVETGRWVSVSLDYILTDGRQVHRTYSVPIYVADLDRADSLASQLTALVNLPGRAADPYFGDMPDRDGITLVTAGIQLYDTVTASYDYYYIEDDSDRARLLEAIRADMDDSALGRRYLFHDLERQENCAVGDIELEFYVPERGDENKPGDEYQSRSWSFRVTPQRTATRTIAVLEDLGIVNDTHLMLTHADEAQTIAAYEASAVQNIAIDETMLVPDNG